MMVVKVYMWPGGDADAEELLCQATFDCQGEATRDAPELGVRQGERGYRVRLLKGPRFGGPGEGAEVRPQYVQKRKVWKEGFVRGHLPGRRGEWDLIGGALRVLLGSRLNPYVSYAPSDHDDG